MSIPALSSNLGHQRNNIRVEPPATLRSTGIHSTAAHICNISLSHTPPTHTRKSSNLLGPLRLLVAEPASSSKGGAGGAGAAGGATGGAAGGGGIAGWKFNQALKQVTTLTHRLVAALSLYLSIYLYVAARLQAADAGSLSTSTTLAH